MFSYIIKVRLSNQGICVDTKITDYVQISPIVPLITFFRKKKDILFSEFNPGSPDKFKFCNLFVSLMTLTYFGRVLGIYFLDYSLIYVHLIFIGIRILGVDFWKKSS